MRRSAVLALTLVVVIGGLVVGGRALVAQEATPADCPVTTPEENEALVRQLLDEVYNQDTTENVDALLADGFVRNHPTNPRPHVEGNADEIEFFTQDPNADVDVEIVFVVASGDMVAVRTITSGLFIYDGVDGFPAEGRPGQHESHQFWRIECGEIAELWAVTDAFTHYRQMGIIIDEELADAHEPTVATPEP